MINYFYCTGEVGTPKPGQHETGGNPTKYGMLYGPLWAWKCKLLLDNIGNVSNTTETTTVCLEQY